MKKYILFLSCFLFIFSLSYNIVKADKPKTELESLREEVNALKLKLVWKDSIEEIIAKTLKEEKAKISTKADIDLLIKELREVKKTRNKSIENNFNMNEIISYFGIVVLLVLFICLLFFRNKNNEQSITVDNRYLIGGGILFILIVLTFTMNRLYIADIMQSELNNLITERELLRNTNLEGQTYDKVISLDNKMEAYKLELQRQNDRIEILAWVLGGTTFFALLVGLYEFIVGIRSRLNEVNKNLENTLNKKVAEDIGPRIEEIARNNPKVFAEAMAKVDEEIRLKTEMKIYVYSFADNEKEMKNYFELMNFKMENIEFIDINLSDNDRLLIKELSDLEEKLNKAIEADKPNIKAEIQDKKQKLRKLLVDKEIVSKADSKGIVFFNNSKKEGFNVFSILAEIFKEMTNDEVDKYAFFYFNDQRIQFHVNNIHQNFANSFPSLYNNLIDLMRYKKNVIDK
jgi:hypothetical protein